MHALFRRFPRLALTLPPIADLGVVETPVERWRVGGVSLLVKRDDLSAPLMGGNKVRALEFLLAGVTPGDVVLTAGSTGSTHALAVARYAALLGASARVVTWPQEEHEVSRATGARLRDAARVTAAGSVATAYARALALRLSRRAGWIPAGASTPLGALGHVSAALELAEQLAARGPSDAPSQLVVPLGTGGTLAGLVAGHAIAESATRIVGVRVVPGVVANRRRVLHLARATLSLVETLSGERLPPIDERLLEIDSSQYGGAYARETDASRAAAKAMAEAGGPALEGTYSAKAFAAALARARADEAVLFWLTFDAKAVRGPGSGD